MARSCKYGQLKTPNRKGKTVRRCKRKPKSKSKKCAKKVCKYGNLKKSRKSKKGTRCCKRKPSVPESIINGISNKINLKRQQKSLNKRMSNVSVSISSESDEVKKLQKQIKLAKLRKHEAKLNKAQASNEAALGKRINAYKAKGGSRAQAVDVYISSMNKRIASI
jgi:hypothetical protein